MTEPSVYPAKDLGAREVGARVEFTAESGARVTDVLAALVIIPEVHVLDAVQPEPRPEDARVWLRLQHVADTTLRPDRHDILRGAFQLEPDAQVRVIYSDAPSAGVLE